LNVPGSPSSALHTTTASPPAALQARHLAAVGYPAPPRPRSPLCSSASSVAAGPAESAAATASPGPRPASSSGPRRRTFEATWNHSGGHASTGTRPRISAPMAPTRAGSRPPMGRPSTSSAGPWSPRPVQLVTPRSSAGSSRTASASARRRATEPAIRSVTLSLNRTRYAPGGRVPRNE
jgi:hypothetical protein